MFESIENDVRLGGKCALFGTVGLFDLMSLAGYTGQLIPGWFMERKTCTGEIAADRLKQDELECIPHSSDPQTLVHCCIAYFIK